MSTPSEIYELNWQRLLASYVPGMRRRPKTLAAMSSLSLPLYKLYIDEMMPFFAEARYRVKHNASIGSIEAVLNEKFYPQTAPEDWPIYITTVQRLDAVRVYSLAAQKQIAINSNAGQPVGIRTSNLYNADAVDFIVHVPASLQPADQTELAGLIIQIRAQVDYYKFYEKKYKIVWTS